MTNLRAISRLWRLTRRSLYASATVWLLSAAGPVHTQSSSEQGRTAETTNGEVGLRQSAKAAAATIRPQARINSRIENRLENRISNRVDRNYDRNANAASQFKRADAKSRATGQQQAATPHISLTPTQPEQYNPDNRN